MVDVNRYRTYVGPKDKGHPPGQPDPMESDERQLPRQRLGREMEESGYVGPPANRDQGYGQQPPGLRADGPEGRHITVEDNHSKPSYDTEAGESEEEIDWVVRAQNAYRTSTDFMDENFRAPLEDSLRAFNNQHPAASKYNSEVFRKRSNLYRPKIRTIIRKNEAALCAALFSNLDLIEVTAANPSEQEEIVSAEVMQQVLQERLTVSLPWFQFAMGSFQDAQTQGIVIAHNYWCYQAVNSRGRYRVKQDAPCMELIAMENFRFDPSAKWYDVVGTSPYLIELIPMYVCDVKERMDLPDPKGNVWYYYDDVDIAEARESANESTRAARSGLLEDPANHPRDVSDYDIVWVHRHIHRYQGEDWQFYMLGTRCLLTEPEPLEDTVWFGERPYVVGTCVLETHKPVPTSLATLLRPLADEANDLMNQTSDNLKFILNKSWMVKRNANVDTAGLTRNQPGRVTMVNDVEKDVKEVSWPDLPKSVQDEKNRNDQDFDSLGGNFNPMMLQQTRSVRESYRTVNAVQSPAMMMTEYTLMTLIQTFMLPCLRQLVLLEQYYETDQNLLMMAGQKAQVLQRFGVSEITDAILEKRMSVNVNLGMGATDPTSKLQRLIQVLSMMSHLAQKPVQGLDLKEVFKELLALGGYRDGMRFLSAGQDPEKAKMMQTIQALVKKLGVYEIDKRNKHESNVVKLVTSREKNLVELAKAAKEDDHESRHLLIGHLLELEKVDRQAEQARTLQAEGAVQNQATQAQGATQQQALAAAKPKGKAA